MSRYDHKIETKEKRKEMHSSTRSYHRLQTISSSISLSTSLCYIIFIHLLSLSYPYGNNSLSLWNFINLIHTISESCFDICFIFLSFSHTTCSSIIILWNCFKHDWRYNFSFSCANRLCFSFTKSFIIFFQITVPKLMTSPSNEPSISLNAFQLTALHYFYWNTNG